MFAPLKSQRRKLKWGLGILINISQSCLPREINRQEPAASGKIYTIGIMETVCHLDFKKKKAMHRIVLKRWGFFVKCDRRVEH